MNKTAENRQYDHEYKVQAVRDKKGNYLGTVEVVQDMQFAKEHFEQ